MFQGWIFIPQQVGKMLGFLIAVAEGRFDGLGLIGVRGNQRFHDLFAVDTQLCRQLPGGRRPL
ncbi:hypothetical protein MMAS_23300 [Mycobacteroides abscessus subsp. massiliense CCUG 48898 = JCM 15300]|nr:hypothetical protein MMAS_23300 [Mycobacteroides abscessus subsp. massiliense CCUG 48898 = JCM 15300]